jgi:hypothetical protein
MIYVAISLMLACILALIGSTWTIICNERTFKARMDLLMKLSAMLPAVDSEEYWKLSKAIDAVTYNAHMWALFTFRNPANLYPSPARELLNG